MKVDRKWVRVSAENCFFGGRLGTARQEVEERAPQPPPNPSHPAGAPTGSLITDFPFFPSFFHTLVSARIQVSSDTVFSVSNTLLVFYGDFIYIRVLWRNRANKIYIDTEKEI